MKERQSEDFPTVEIVGLKPKMYSAERRGYWR